MEEAHTSQSLNPHAQEFRPFSSNYSHHYRHNYASNYPPPPPTSTSSTTTTTAAAAAAAFLSPPLLLQEPPVLPPHQQFHQTNYQNYPYALNTTPHHHDHHYYYYYPKPLSLSLSQSTLPPHSLLPPSPPPPPPLARPKPLWVKPEAAGPSGSGNICRRRRRQGCNYVNKAGLISGGRKVGSRDPQGQNGDADHLDGSRRVWVEREEKKNKKLWGRERMKKEVMPVKPQGMETTVMIRNVPNQYT